MKINFIPLHSHIPSKLITGTNSSTVILITNFVAFLKRKGVNVLKKQENTQLSSRCLKKAWHYTCLFTNSILFVVIAIFPLYGAFSATPTQIPAPTTIAPKFGDVINEKQPLIKGVTLNDTLVEVYVDNILNGQATVKNGHEGVASWVFRIPKPLNLGEHRISTVAHSINQQETSSHSQYTIITMVSPYPAPILQKIATNDTDYTRPLINGLAINGSTIEVFIDGKLDGSFVVIDHTSGTASFEYQPASKLTVGWHSIKLRAHDAAGKTSNFSPSKIIEIRGAQNIPTTNAPSLHSRPHPEPTEVVAPTLLNPKTGTVTQNKQLVIDGLVHNNQTIQIFVDGILNGEINPKPHESGVTSFTYKPYVDLNTGIHDVYARAIDDRGQKSSRSNILSFMVHKSSYSIITSDTIQHKSLVPPTVKTEPPSRKQVSKTPAPPVTPSPPVTPPSAQTNQEKITGKVDDRAVSVITPHTQPDTNSVAIDALPTTQTPNKDKQIPVQESETDELKDSKIVVIGESNTESDQTGRNNTGIIIALAIAAIIIIGLISWFTTSKRETDTLEKADQDTESQKPTGQLELTPEPSTIWETEPPSETPIPPTIPSTEQPTAFTQFDDISPPPEPMSDKTKPPRPVEPDIIPPPPPLGRA